MIVKEKKEGFLLISQHEHATISGELADQWRDPHMMNKQREEVVTAIREHDRGWIELDAHPLWNEDQHKPYSFWDYPETIKLAHYTKGIDEVEEETSYGAYLSSLHYDSFFTKSEQSEAAERFLDRERTRRQRIEALLDSKSFQYTDTHLELLQFCDDLSLYCCMNEPGALKEKELSWFRDGFRQRFSFAPDGVLAHWKDEKTVTLHPYPFKEEVEISVPYREVTRKEVEEYGLVDAYRKACVESYPVLFVPEGN
ncbi:serine hydroxymethyltransferase [Pontibacillus halophilus JSM 076056 = DSM 19796]|uniref:Serine hydroxymethyltransferase n=1 Tax=Pontibacillus halophilus JSM 076056 = DSM 19796 TaxID=1385510 RepID=A0A0A5GR61_9BACI|nr:DUF3891 family protein [Pontibacillus halophilus]KGX93650.1 serine hydroxymethyltransferase [Pontibacillus halophilus JSM 076056 = DSM 19796]